MIFDNLKLFLQNKSTKDASSIFIASIILAGSNWAQLSILTKKCDLYIVGVYTLALAISNPIFQLTNIQLRSIYVSDRQNKFNFSDYFSVRIFSTFFTIIIGVLLSLFIFKNQKTGLLLSVLIFISYGIDGIIDIFNADLHNSEKFVKISYSTTLRAVASFIGLFFGVIFLKNPLLGVSLSVLFKTTSLLLYDFRGYRQVNKLTINLLKKNIGLIKIGIPLGLTLLISSININIPKYFVNIRFGLEMQGVFSSMSYVIVVGTMFVATFGQIIMPKMAQYYSNKNTSVLKKINTKYLFSVLILGLILFFFAVFFGEIFLFYFFSEKISAFHLYFPWIMGSSIFVYLVSAMGYCLTAVSVLKEQFYIAIVALIINIFPNFIFIKTSTLEGIVLFSGISFLIQFVLGLLLFNKKIKSYAR